MGDGAVGLAPDFGGGGGVVGRGVRGITVLVRVKILFAIGFVDFADAADGAVGAFVSRRIDDFDAVGREDVFAFGRGAGGKAEFDAVTECGADHGVGDAGVATGCVEDYFAGAQVAGAFAGTDHGIAGAVFHGAAGIEPFCLGVKFDVGEAGDDAFQAQERSVADAVEEMLADFGVGGAGCVAGSDCRFVGCVHGAWFLFVLEARASDLMRVDAIRATLPVRCCSKRVIFRYLLPV